MHTPNDVEGRIICGAHIFVFNPIWAKQRGKGDFEVILTFIL